MAGLKVVNETGTSEKRKKGDFFQTVFKHFRIIVSIKRGHSTTTNLSCGVCLFKVGWGTTGNYCGIFIRYIILQTWVNRAIQKKIKKAETIFTMKAITWFFSSEENEVLPVDQLQYVHGSVFKLLLCPSLIQKLVRLQKIVSGRNKPLYRVLEFACKFCLRSASGPLRYPNRGISSWLEPVQSSAERVRGRNAVVKKSSEISLRLKKNKKKNRGVFTVARERPTGCTLTRRFDFFASCRI